MGLFSFLKKNTTINNETDMMDNVVDSMFNSKPLYDRLKVKCHPDLFLDDKQKDKAQVLFQRLQKVKYDISAMKELEFEIEELYKQR